LIPRAYIVEWRHKAPWIFDAQVEQDLVISRTLVAIFGNRTLGKELAFRGGTALHKIHSGLPKRYSEDIDLVQVEKGPIGSVIDLLQEILNPFLGKPIRSSTERAFTMVYRMNSELPPVVSMRLKLEINTREHFSVLGFEQHPFSVGSKWFEGDCRVNTFHIDELLGTKLRALYQRRKGRDLLDLWIGLTECNANASMIVKVFKHYMKNEDKHVSRKEYEENLFLKMKHRGFLSDVDPLLAAGVDFNMEEAYRLIKDEVLSRL
jgi:predicted nucleotidyltransferase component of viral defense system